MAANFCARKLLSTRHLKCQLAVVVFISAVMIVLLHYASSSDALKLSDLLQTFGIQSTKANAHFNRRSRVRTQGNTVQAVRHFKNSESQNTNDCAILYLACWQRVEELVSSLKLLFKNFNSKYRYPVIIFYDDKNGTEPFHIRSLLKMLKLDKKDKQLISFEFLHFTYPHGISEDSLILGHIKVAQVSFPGYNHMISFWAYHVFHHPAVTKLQYILRMDTDSNIYQPVTMDLFAMMKESDYHYAFRFEIVDPEWVVLGMAKFLVDYVKERRIVPSQPKNFKLVEDAVNKSEGMPSYYNNMEIMHIPTFLRTDLEDFRQSLYDSNYIYTHRWGDAPLRYAMVNLFLKNHKVHRIYECAYEHQGMRVPVNHFFEPPDTAQ